MQIANTMEPPAFTGAAAESDTSDSFWNAGHRPTLIAAFLYFDLAFMVWVLLGPLAPDIARDLGLSPAAKGLMVATPTLAGAVLRLFVGLFVDRIGPKRTGAISQAIVIAGLFTAWVVGVHSLGATLLLGGLLGFAGASFAVALPLASRWYPPQHQGKAMGLAGMGNSGTVLAALFAPILAKMFGWNAVLGLACIPLTVVLALYMVMAKDAPNAPAPKPITAYLRPLKSADAWWFMLFYGVTFGGFSGLASSLFGDAGCRKRVIGRLVHHMIRATRILPEKGFDEPLLAWRLSLGPDARSLLDLMLDLIRDEVIFSASVQHLEFKGKRMVVATFEALMSSPKKLLPPAVAAEFERAEDRPRVVCDYLASLTDAGLVRLHDRLFSPRSGAVFDRL